MFRANASEPLELIVRTGDVAPYTEGAVFGSWPFSVLAFGSLGEIAFSIPLQDDPEDPSPDEFPVYLLDAEDRLFPIVRFADLIALGYASQPAFGTHAFDLAFSRVAMSPVTFSDSSAVIVATIPEPSAHDASLAALFLLAATALTTARKPPPA